MIERKYKRKYFRIKPCGISYNTLTISSYKGKKLKTGSAVIKLHNLSMGGLKFSSALNLPVGKELLLEFNMRVPGKVVKSKGYIVYRYTGKDSYIYGVRFIEANSNIFYCFNGFNDNPLWLMEKKINISTVK